MFEDNRHRYVVQSDSNHQDSMWLLIETSKSPTYAVTLFMDRENAVDFVRSLADFVQFIIDKMDETHDNKVVSFYDTLWDQIMVVGRNEKANGNNSESESLPF